MRRWRLLRHGPAPGPFNMGVDELLLRAAQQGEPSLRVYAWEGPWLSLGYTQRIEPARLRACQSAGVGVVRRATGGGAVLHGYDVTYAVAAPAALVGGDLHASSARIARGLLVGLRALGIDAVCAAAPEGRRGPTGFDCFATAGAHEILAQGQKLCGSAQRRTRAALLQHGSLRLGPVPEAIRAAAGLVSGRATSLGELGLDVIPQVVSEALVAGLAAELRADPTLRELSPDELRAAQARGDAPLGASPRSQGAL